MKRKILSLVLALALCVGLASVGYAATPRYINEIGSYNEVGISGNEAVMYSEMDGASNITKVVMTHVLQKKSGSSYSNVSGTSVTRTFYNDNAPYMEDTVACSGAGTYRVKTTYTVTSPNGTDTHTRYSDTVDN